MNGKLANENDVNEANKKGIFLKLSSFLLFSGPLKAIKSSADGNDH